MNKLIGIITCFFVIISAGFSQTYSTTGAAIPDHGAPLQVILNVSGLDSLQLNTNYGIETVCININHTADRDLAVYLMSPSGMSVELTSGNGGFNDNYTNTCFNMSASALIISGVPPYTGTFVPEHSIGSFNNGQAGNGFWRLIVTDYAIGDTGSVIDFSITFGYSPPTPLAIPTGPCDDYSPGGCLCANGDSTCWLMPDIITATSMLQDTFYQREYFRQLQVTNSSANIGYGPMEIVGTGVWKCNDSIVTGPGFCPDSTYAKQVVKQRIYIKNAGVNFFDFKDTIVGTMQFHSDLGHNHLHVDDWEINTLRLRGPSADITTWPIVGLGNKVSFCIYDMLICGGTFNNCQYGSDINYYASLPNNGLGTGFSSCGTTVQGLSVGYSDIYDYTLAGQEINFDTLCNGNYYLVSEFDPSHRFVDMDRSNNISVVPVKLKHQMPNCCVANFRIDTINYDENIYQFVDLTKPIPDHWQWNFGNGMIDTTQFPIIDFNDSSALHISLQTSNNEGCSDSTFKIIIINRDFSDTCRNVFSLMKFEGDWFSSFVISGDTAIIDSISVEFYDTSTVVYSMQEASFTLFNSSHYPNMYIIYDSIKITIFYKNSCVYVIDTIYQIGVEGIEEIQIDFHTSLVPNPAKNETVFSYELKNNEMVNLTLYDATGKLIENIIDNQRQLSGKHQYKIQLPDAGFYILRSNFGQVEHIDKVFSYK